MSADTEKSAAFYSDLFGWTAEDAGEEYGHYVNFSKDGDRVAGMMQRTPEMGAPMDVWSVYLNTPDADAAAEAAKANGGEVMVPPMDVGTLGRMFVVTDAGGAVIGGWEPKEFPCFGRVHENGTPGWFELWTRDFDKTVAFYEKVFKWEAHNVGDSDEFRYTTLFKDDDGEAGVMDASGFLPEGVPAHWSIYFRVESTDDALTKIASLGGNTVQPAEDTPYGRLATAIDSTGAVFKLMS
jgi:predicted enzyme related to lactoylglutathione lyase